MKNYIDLTTIRRMAEELAEYRDENERLFLDTLDGETDALDILDHEIEAEQADRAMHAAIKARIADLKARADRLDMRADAHRRVQHQVLKAIGLRKVERPLATLSIRAGSLGVTITDPESIPTQLCKTTVQPDKAAIRAQIEAGVDVPGAILERGAETLSVRVR